MSSLKDIQEQVKQDVERGYYSKEAGEKVVEKARSLRESKSKVTKGPDSSKDKSSDSDREKDPKGPPSVTPGSDPYSSDDDDYYGDTTTTKLASGLHEITPKITPASTVSSTSTGKAASGLHDSDKESDPDLDAKNAAILAENTKIREENARIQKENKLKDDTWNKYKAYHSADGTKLDASKLWAETWETEGSQAADDLVKDFRVLGYDENLIREIASEGTDTYVYNRATKLLDPYVGSVADTKSVAEALNDPNITVKTFEEGGYDNIEAVLAVETYKDYLDADGNVSLESVIRSGKFNSLNAQKKLKKDLGVTSSDITAEQSRLVLDKAGGVEAYLSKNQGTGARSLVTSARLSTETGDLLKSTDVRTMQTLAPYKEIGLTGSTLNVGKLLDDRKAGKVKITDRDLIANTDLNQDSLNTIKFAKEGKISDPKVQSALSDKEKESAFSRILTGGTIFAGSSLPTSVEPEIVRQEVNIEGLNIKEGSREHQALVNASKSGAEFALELVPVIGTGYIATKIASQPGGFTEANWKQLAMLGLSGALDVITISTLGRGAPLSVGAKTAVRTVATVHNLRDAARIAGKVPFQTAGFVAKVVTSPIRGVIQAPRVISQAPKGLLNVVKSTPSKIKQVVTKKPTTPGKPKAEVGDQVSDLVINPTPLIRPSNYAEVGRTLVGMVPKGTPSVKGALDVTTKAATSVVKGTGTALKEGWDAPFRSTLKELGSDTKFVVTKPLRALKETGEVLTGKRVLSRTELAKIEGAIGVEAVAKTAKEQAEVFQKIAVELAGGEGKLVQRPVEIYSDFLPDEASLRAQGYEPIYGKVPGSAKVGDRKLVGYKTVVESKVGEDAIIVVRHDAKTKNVEVSVSRRPEDYDIPDKDDGLPGVSHTPYGKPDIGGPSGPRIGGDDGGVGVKEKIQVGIKSLEDLMSGGTIPGSKMYVKRPEDFNIAGLTTPRQPRSYEGRRQDDPRYQGVQSPEVSSLRGYSVTTFPDAPVVDPWTIPDMPDLPPHPDDDPLTWPEITPVKPHPNGSPNGVPSPDKDPGRTAPDWKPGPKRRGPGTPLDDPLHPYTPKTVPVPDYDPIREPLVKVPPMDDPYIAPGSDPLEKPFTLPSPGTQPWSMPEVTRIQQPQSSPWTQTGTRTDTQTRTDTVLKPITTGKTQLDDLPSTSPTQFPGTFPSSITSPSLSTTGSTQTQSSTSPSLDNTFGNLTDLSQTLQTNTQTTTDTDTTGKTGSEPKSSPQERTGDSTTKAPGDKSKTPGRGRPKNGGGKRKSKIRPILPSLGGDDPEKGTTALLVLDSTPPGSGRGIPKTLKVPTGQRITITAKANKGWQFDHWEGDIEPQFVNRRQASIEMDDDRFIKAVFVPGGKPSETYIHKFYPKAIQSKKHTEVARMKGRLGRESKDILGFTI